MEVKAQILTEFSDVFVGLDEVKLLFEKQQQHRQQSKDSTWQYRVNKLKLLRKTVKKYRTAIQDALEKDLGKPSFEADVSETFTIIAELSYTISHLKSWMRPDRVISPLHYFGSVSRVYYEPKGNCLLISPWNIPFYLTIPYAATCFAAGNTAIVKTSEYVPNSSRLIKKILGEVFSEEEIAVVSMDAESAGQLVYLPFDHIHFTGSTRVGKHIKEAAAEHMTSVTLELGGKSPLILHDDVNIKSIVPRIVWGKLVNLGQVCIAVDYILVPRSIANEFIREMVSYIKKHFGDHPLESEMLGRIVNQRNLDRLERVLQDAVNRGSVVEHGGKVMLEKLFIEPTILTNVPNDALIMEEEIFGPILPVVTYDHLEEALAIIRSKPKPLALYIFGKNKKWIRQVIQNTTAGGTSINEVIGHFTNSALPAGGVNHSGIGKTHGRAGFIDFSNERAVMSTWLKSGITWPFAFPYSTLKRRIANFLIKYW